MDYDTFAKEHNVDYRLESGPPEGKMVRRMKMEPSGLNLWNMNPIIDTYKRLNEPQGRLADHQGYLRIARIGLGTEYPGATLGLVLVREKSQDFCQSHPHHRI